MEGFWLSASALSVAEKSTLTNFKVPAVADEGKPANQQTNQPTKEQTSRSDRISDKDIEASCTIPEASQRAIDRR
jgi:hypothetical protein